MINIDSKSFTNRKSLEKAIFDQFLSSREFFRILLSVDEINHPQTWEDLRGKVSHQLWQSLYEPWIFIIFIDISPLLPTIKDFVSIFNSNVSNSVAMKEEDYWNHLLQVQSDNFIVLFEGEPVFYDSTHRRIDLPFDLFNDFTHFPTISTTYDLFKGKSYFSYKGNKIDEPIQIKRLFFHVMHHPEQYLKETLTEAIDKLMTSFKAEESSKKLS